MPETTTRATSKFNTAELSFDDFKKIVIDDYRIGYESRQASLIGRREVLTGKAKFGIFGDGKEVAQLAMAKAFRAGDWRAGYYRDQTFMFATGMSNMKEFFAQLYANPDIEKDPASGGRQMNCHYATRFVNTDGSWVNQAETMNSSSDISTTAGQIPRLLGLAYASKLYRQNKELDYLKQFSVNGNEVAFGSVGNGATSEGSFFETFNAGGVLQVPMAISIWDDAYAISVPANLQTTKEDISEILKGFQRENGSNGYEIFKVRGWDYIALCETYERAINICREEHVPVLIHVTEMTQPQGHSTSGSHERYKSRERLTWEDEHDCLLKMREWMITSAISTEIELEELEAEAKRYVRECQREAANELAVVIKSEIEEAAALIDAFAETVPGKKEVISALSAGLRSSIDAGRREIFSAIRKTLRLTTTENNVERQLLTEWLKAEKAKNTERYNSKLFTGTPESPLYVPVVPAVYSDDARLMDGREVLNAAFDANFARDKSIVAFGEDLGAIGDVNQGFAGLQAKYGEIRITDTGIRETSIIGQGMGLAMRGLRPIAEIQYLDYLIYAITIISDDIASLSYRTMGGQKAPLIIRTRGHRLEGIWHSGSPMSVILGSMRGFHICVPRNMTQAAGMYNTLLRGDEPALVIECLNGYRLKEKLPANVGEFTVPLGKAEVLREGSDITVVSYGSTLRIVQEASEELAEMGINIEIIDPQTLYPFDTEGVCGVSLKKTSKLLVVDEDLPGAGSAYILQKIMEGQNGYYALDAQPKTLTAKEHRPPYGSDGDYFSKPSVDDVVEIVYAMMNEANPSKYPAIY
ncbi:MULTISPECIES: alpha-ketoacid dehydrogenase subunit alpha/beta [Mucilaginibacter]|jgi:pyruvate/2-oxoglutarate/acetoin dehydrogenase E1 component/TPP-dependent pyruvate/acetoin dehydrogenase alpha subunit|uniref:alpha-ketoacid dehydrogenase subunit alpha/beta n=1 Tax=Mucilaginibacter TaxID=423349 RepID=UPI0008717309|nr:MULTISPECIES: alpha-ketoacid dehydrogenase subunit alpha/beta [Mucilaginibacter]NVM67733.1 pyruvate/2-oxoglutarate/acetoin dehydrogenase E1 component/TPP-dependent pyruvate/acetoin dehydrogenase alpha subunit [Mucilaginibacter sp. SG538B]GGA95311.1 transketolase [Mucilaginibacter rubeus]SCW48911.1 Pyruvate/2-oxoglutarate/acetoin dehydrogenase complex, dehydrogenase (E1) component [Mucilaginibacter sp. NFR10]